MHESPEDNEVLEFKLRQLYNLLTQLEALQARFDEIMARYQGHMFKPWRRWDLGRRGIIIIAAAALALNIWNIHLFLYTCFIGGVVLVVGGVYAIVRGGPARRLSPVLLAVGAAMLVLLFGGESLLGLRLTGVGLLLVLVGGSVVLLRTRNAFVPAANKTIAARNQKTFDKAYQEAASELAPIEQQIMQIQTAFRELDFRPKFPEKYLASEAVKQLIPIVADRRADTIKEAVNVYVKDLHNQYMRDAADRQIALQELQLEEQRRTTKAINTASALNIGMQAFQGSMTRNAIRQEGASTRSAISAAASKPRDVRIRPW